MQEAVFSWIKNIAYYMIMVTAVLHVLPNTDYQKYIRLFTGMVVVLLLATPVLRLFGVDQEARFLYYLQQFETKIKSAEDIEMYEREWKTFEEELQEAEKENEIKIDKIEIGE